MAKTPLRWFGAKTKLAGLLPEHDHYVELMAGSAAVLFAKQPARLETVNDVDGNIVNFFRVLRDPDQAAELARLVSLTPYSRCEFDTCRALDPEVLTPVERAWRLLVVCNQAVGNAGQGWSTTYRASAVSAARSHRWRMLPDRLQAAARRLVGVQVEALDWRTVLDRYDAPGVCLFVDPPYHPDVRPNSYGDYAHEFAADEHAELIDRLLALRHANAVVTHYPHPVYDDLERAGWGVVDLAGAADNATQSRQERRTERVWLSSARGQLSFQGVA